MVQHACPLGRPPSRNAASYLLDTLPARIAERMWAGALGLSVFEASKKIRARSQGNFLREPERGGIQGDRKIYMPRESRIITFQWRAASSLCLCNSTITSLWEPLGSHRTPICGSDKIAPRAEKVYSHSRRAAGQYRTGGTNKKP